MKDSNPTVMLGRTILTIIAVILAVVVWVLL